MALEEVADYALVVLHISAARIFCCDIKDKMKILLESLTWKWRQLGEQPDVQIHVHSTCYLTYIFYSWVFPAAYDAASHLGRADACLPSLKDALLLHFHRAPHCVTVDRYQSPGCLCHC